MGKKKIELKKKEPNKHIIEIILDDDKESLAINTTDIKSNDDAVKLIKMMITTLSSMAASFGIDEEQLLNALDTGIHEAKKDKEKIDKDKTK